MSDPIRIRIALTLRFHPVKFHAKTIIMIARRAPYFDLYQNSSESHARISQATAIQNHTVVDRNVRPSLCHAEPIICCVAASAQSFVTPKKRSAAPTRIRIAHAT